MKLIRYTLLADGSSDRALMGPLQWLVEQHFPALRTVPQFAGNGIPPAREGLRARIEAALRTYPCEVLFIHRDAEKEPRAVRVEEIRQALPSQVGSWIPVIPVRMTEAWLLGSEEAIRCASGNRNGKQVLNLPSLAQLERLADPKEVLFECIRAACGPRSRRRAPDVERIRTTVADYISDFSHLRGLASFLELERQVRETFEFF
ncbi:hypothetical protein ACQUJS_23530 [Ralstonia pseudosolanacearum]|uniref:DUF4276 family protein n=1 Tax=Ralstonia solanacearum TaxID=305 RepID=A0A0S4TTE4_RALSL|nr:conserved protein of unknown function [Ralstonia solanacearum]